MSNTHPTRKRGVKPDARER